MFAIDEARIAEELAGAARPAPASLAPGHLLQALDALDDACNGALLVSPRKPWPLEASDSPAAWRTLAGIRQEARCCAATVFAAFAAEAFINDFLALHLTGKVSARQFQEIDRRWPTARKYVEGVARAYAPLFEEGDEVVPMLRELFAERNRLVHSRPGQGPPGPLLPDPSWRNHHPPTKVAEWVIAVAGATEVLERRCYGFDYQSTPGTAIWFGRDIVGARARAAEPLPKTAADQPQLIGALYDHLEAHATKEDSPRLTVHKLREARLRLAAQQGPWDAFTEMLLRNDPEG